MYFARLSLVLISTCTFVLSGLSQNNLRFGLGRFVIDESIDSNGSYNPWLFTAEISNRLTASDQNFSVHAVVSAQYGRTTYRNAGRRAYDVALNLSLELQWQPNPEWGLQLGIGSGPAYQSVELPFQAQGFIFSNNLILGGTYSPNPWKVTINPRIQFRHMSNASLYPPNNGIDNIMVSLAVQMPL